MDIRRSERFISGFCKFDVTDQDGNKLPGPTKCGYVEYDASTEYYDNNNAAVEFVELKPAGNYEDKCFVCFELYIAVDERGTPDFIRPTNDLSLLLDESLLADSVLRVSGREISVHRAVLAARWPRFYERVLAGSKGSTVNVGEIEPEVFEKLLKCVYSNRIPTSLLQEPAWQEMSHILEPIWHSGRIQTNDQHSISSSTNISIADLDERRNANPHSTPEIEVSASKYIPHRCFAYNTVIAIDTYTQPAFALGETFDTVYTAEDTAMITATWKMSLEQFDMRSRFNHCQLELIALENASSVRARTRFCILNGRGEKSIESIKFKQFNLNDDEQFPLDLKSNEKVNAASSPESPS